MYLRDGHYELVGITSWGVGCGREGEPAVFAKVQVVLDWITSYLT